MKYFSIYIPNAQTNGGGPTPDGQASMQQFVEQSIARGEFISGGGFLPLASHGAVLRRTHGETQLIDGPYAESKELVGGFAMLEYASREAAIAGARRFLEVAGDGECLTYRIAEGPHDETC